ncbi:tethering complex subunit [Dimargaris verticillata]|uniref:Tethering complex subunit n=1 Tax=Dimargaris verticillata TaxID=2761393 RepID=A0A9W8B6P5_9FUNG|nr:tethering complex subunit [Dimargaris verticillata]
MEAVNLAPLADLANDIFSLDRVQFSLPTRLVTACVSNNILVLALENNHILRIDLQQASAIDDVELPRKSPDLRIRKLFFDPTGRHLFIATDQGENYYLFETWQKPKLLSKLKNLHIESVAWNKAAVRSSRNSTKSILLGTQDGQLLETEIEPTEDFFRREERFLRLVYTLPEPAPITGVHYEAFPATPRKYFVLVTTPNRIYQFVGLVDLPAIGASVSSAAATNSPATVGQGSAEAGGKPMSPATASDGPSMFEPLFRGYQHHHVFQEIPGELSHSELRFYSPLQDVAYQSVAHKFAWLTGPGVYHGQLTYGSQSVGDSVVADPVLLPYPSASTTPTTGGPSNLQPGMAEPPLAMVLTEFHVVLLYKTSLKAVCLLNDKVVFDEPIPLLPGERALRLGVDTVHNTFWVFTPSAIFELLITQEDRYVWKIYLQKKMYETAFQYARTSAEKNLILGAQADQYYAQGRFVLSATYYAQTTKPFEEIALKFVAQPDQKALECYLSQKLERLRKSDLTQITLLATWLVEIYLHQLNQLDATLQGYSEDDPAYVTCQDEQTSVRQDFYGLLNGYKKHLDKQTVYGMIQSHGRSHEFLYFATVLGDYDQVIAHWIAEGEYLRAIEVLSKHGQPPLFYKFTPTLLRWQPEEVVNVLMRQPDLSPRKLIPAFVKYQETRNRQDTHNQVLRYLMFVINKQDNRDPVIHNYVLAVFASQATLHESALLEFLANEGHRMNYDVDYALRICRQHNRIQSCVHLYSLVGQYEDAVDLALKHGDLDLAEINADKPDNNSDLRRRLWLKIVRHVVEMDHDVKKAIGLLQKCPLLSVEQILPYFPAFTQIDDFKDEICAALEDYDRHIDDLRTEMDEATRNAKAIQHDIRHLRNRFVLVEAGETCGICEAPLLARQFYAFPCQHIFHADCLVRKVTNYMLPRRRQRVAELQRQITQLLVSKPSVTGRRSPVAANNGSMTALPGNASESGGLAVALQTRTHRLGQLKSELDSFVAAECILCGEMMIKTVDCPFVDADKEHELIASWGV